MTFPVGGVIWQEPVGLNQLKSQAILRFNATSDQARSKFIVIDRDTDYVLPPSLGDWLLENRSRHGSSIKSGVISLELNRNER